MKKVEIYIATHKQFQQLDTDSCYYPMHVGAAITPSLGYKTDATGDNISHKNKNYCELTGLYWIWKNSDADIVGLEHYRRYLVTKGGYLKKLLTGKNCGVITEQQIIKDLEKHDVIVAKNGYAPITKKNLIEGYAGSHNERDILETIKIIKEKYPEYTKTVDYVFSKLAFQPANVIIAKKEVFDAYCAWLFDILFELEKRIDISEYTDYQKRVFGFIGERIFRVWLLQNKVKMKKRHLINTDAGNVFNTMKFELKRFMFITKSDKEITKADEEKMDKNKNTFII